MTYKLVKDPFLDKVNQVKYTDGTNIVLSIPFDPDNVDYQNYLAWVAEGNTADPAD
jgi:hypothetical protein